LAGLAHLPFFLFCLFSLFLRVSVLETALFIEGFTLKEIKIRKEEKRSAKFAS